MKIGEAVVSSIKSYVTGQRSCSCMTDDVLLKEYEAIWGRPLGGAQPKPTPAPDETEAQVALRQQQEDKVAAHNEDAYRKDVQAKGQAALCLSGGGIRSAAFSLGVLQVLARQGLLTQFHYLSTVSGGGYIGGWLWRWIAGNAGQDAAAIEKVLGRQSEVLQVSNLRANTNFLTPKTGMTSADTWTGILLWCRNVLLNWTVFIPALLFAVIAPNVYLALMTWLAVLGPTQVAVFGWQLPTVLLAIATLSLSVAAWQTIRSLPSHRASVDLSSAAITWRIVVPLLLWAGLMPLVLVAGNYTKADESILYRLLGMSFTAKIVGYVFAWVENHREHDPVRRKQNARLYRRNLVTWLIVVAIATGGLWLAIRIINDLSMLLPDAGFLLPSGGDRPAGADASDIAKLAPAVAAFVFLLSFLGPLAGTLTHLLLSALYMGFRHTGFQDDADREWLARVSAVTVFPTILWAIFALICLFLPFVFIRNAWLMAHWRKTGITIEWLGKALGVVSGLVAVLGGKSAAVKLDAANGAQKTGQTKAHELTVRVATLFFIAMLFMVLAHVERTTAEKMASTAVGSEGFNPINTLLLLLLAICVPFYPLLYFRSRWMLGLIGFVAGLFPAYAIVLWAIGMTESLSREILVAHGLITGGLFVIVSITAVRIDVNRFSMHGVYRNRLVRGFLGAARASRTQRDLFTSFDPADNCRVTELAAKKGSLRVLYPVINVTLNLVGGENLAWQERKASSFVITPLYSGSGALGRDVTGRAADDNPQKRCGAYVETKDYGGSEPDLGGAAGAAGNTGISLGTALTISGAAASPSMGYHSAPATAFLMTLFNVRLGAWLANPAAEIRKDEVKAGPTSALKPLLTEALGLTDARSDNVYLSDGGHFDNLGVYEMIRRRCRYMLVVDADEDEKFAFEDLARAVRFAAIDLDATIEFKSIKMKTRLTADQKSPTFAIGRVTYAEAPNEESWLIYLKPTYFFEDAPVDVRSYGTVNEKFPHDTTLNQWFSESQFESYRRLGEYLMCRLYDDHHQKMKAQAGARGATDPDLADLFNAVSDSKWRPAPAPPPAAPAGAPAPSAAPAPSSAAGSAPSSSLGKAAP